MLFSFIIPVYNSEKKIGRCLESLAKQTFLDFEVVLVNDGSKDGSETIIKNFISKHKDLNVNLLYQQNSGAGIARNTGICYAKGEYIVFLDSDDYIEVDYLEHVFEKIQTDNADVIFIDIVREREDGKVIRRENMSDFAMLTKKRLIRWQLTGKTPWGGCRKIVRASIIKDYHLEYAPIKVGEESIFSFRILEIADRISFQPKAIYHYVESDTSLTSHDVISNSEEVFNFMYGYLKENNKEEIYRRTIGAMAITTVAITLNLISKKRLSYSTYSQMRHVIKQYKLYFAEGVDIDSLDNRVKLCYPWIVTGFPLPIFIMSRFLDIVKKIRNYYR